MHLAHLLGGTGLNIWLFVSYLLKEDPLTYVFIYHIL